MPAAETTRHAVIDPYCRRDAQDRALAKHGQRQLCTGHTEYRERR